MARTSPELAEEISAWVARPLVISGQLVTRQSTEQASTQKIQLALTLMTA